MPFSFEKRDGTIVQLPTGPEDKSFRAFQEFMSLMREKHYDRVPGIDGLVPVGMSEEDIEYWRRKTEIKRRKIAYQKSLR